MFLYYFLNKLDIILFYFHFIPFRSVKQAVDGSLANRYQGQHVRMFLEEAAIMDPRMKKKSFLPAEAWERVTEKVVALMVSKSFLNYDSDYMTMFFITWNIEQHILNMF